ncbi:MAG: SUMF1/EgtB/PvdO family nonheme iron enzyme [Anaerolineae bacterium]|nr:SUMF1/EgtB/PvdO family nonheme iron enzyme [Anaerolineae bacterium]
MLDVFVSYSRRNLGFVQLLVNALKKGNKALWFDQIKEPLEGIAPGTRFWEEIAYGIENSDNFLFVATPQSVASAYCHAEIAHARYHLRRIVMVLYCGENGEGDTWRDIDAAIKAIPDDSELPRNIMSPVLSLKMLASENWLELSKIQYVMFSDSIQFEQSSRELIRALDIDLAWIKLHSQLRQAAVLWAKSNFSYGYLWSAERLKPVYEMLERRKPELDPLVLDFIRPESEHLLAELEHLDIGHHRRSAIGNRLEAIGDTREGVGLRVDGLPDIKWVPVPAGKIELKDYYDGKNLGEFDVSPFYIAQYPITYSQFQVFLDASDGFDIDEWWQVVIEKYRKQRMNEQSNKFDNHPRDSVSWYQAVAFCRWLTAKLPRDAWPSDDVPIGNDWIIRLPTEWEWQHVATCGQKDFVYPWGKEWDGRRTNTNESGLEQSTAVGVYPHGASPCKALDMSGNVWEWCLNEFDNPANTYLGGNARRTLRGGSYYYLKTSACSDYRGFYLPYGAREFFGFRVALGSSLL